MLELRLESVDSTDALFISFELLRLAHAKRAVQEGHGPSVAMWLSPADPIAQRQPGRLTGTYGRFNTHLSWLGAGARRPPIGGRESLCHRRSASPGSSLSAKVRRGRSSYLEQSRPRPIRGS